VLVSRTIDANVFTGPQKNVRGQLCGQRQTAVVPAPRLAKATWGSVGAGNLLFNLPLLLENKNQIHTTLPIYVKARG